MTKPDRSRFFRPLRWLFLCVVLTTSIGCVSGLATAVWLIEGGMVPGEYEGLKGKRVAVVCRPLAGLRQSDSGVPNKLAAQVNQRLAENVPKIDMVRQGEVDEWIDEKRWEDYPEIGEAVDADVVVGIDLEQFSLREGETVYQGRSNIRVTVHDCKTGAILFERILPEVVYPPHSPKSSADQQEADFRREFVGIVADMIGHHFYAHDPRASFAMDATAMR